jgi:hypothetical protein
VTQIFTATAKAHAGVRPTIQAEIIAQFDKILIIHFNDPHCAGCHMVRPPFKAALRDWFHALSAGLPSQTSNNGGPGNAKEIPAVHMRFSCKFCRSCAETSYFFLKRGSQFDQLS